jgi:hypothetical protein
MNQSQVIKLTEIKQFLIENFTESKTMIVRLFDVNVNTLSIFMRRESAKHEKKTHENHNKILKKHEKKFVHRFIESLLNHVMSFTFKVVFDDIVTLKLAQNALSSSES